MKRHRRLILAALAIAAVGGAPTACYQRVVRTKGLGVRTEAVHEANLSNEPGLLDRLDEATGGRPLSKKRK